MKVKGEIFFFIEGRTPERPSYKVIVFDDFNEAHKYWTDEKAKADGFILQYDGGSSAEKHGRLALEFPKDPRIKFGHKLDFNVK